MITLGDSEEEDGYDATHSQSMLGLQEEVGHTQFTALQVINCKLH